MILKLSLAVLILSICILILGAVLNRDSWIEGGLTGGTIAVFFGFVAMGLYAPVSSTYTPTRNFHILKTGSKVILYCDDINLSQEFTDYTTVDNIDKVKEIVIVRTKNSYGYNLETELKMPWDK